MKKMFQYRGKAMKPGRPAFGFTLVEMLVVVLIMALLIGLMVRTMGGAGERAEVAATQAKIEKLKAALEEFYAEYGQYPPVPFYDDLQPVYMEFPAEYTGKNAKYSGVGESVPYFTMYDKQTTDEKERLFTLGLVSFLLPRYETVMESSPYFNKDERKQLIARHGQWKYLNPAQEDLSRDRDAYARWRPFLDGVISGGDIARGPDPTKEEGITHINLSRTIVDSWGQELRYESLPPHQSYKVWSIGPNHKNENGRGDDIGVAMNK